MSRWHLTLGLADSAGLEVLPLLVLQLPPATRKTHTLSSPPAI